MLFESWSCSIVFPRPNRPTEFGEPVRGESFGAMAGARPSSFRLLAVRSGSVGDQGIAEAVAEEIQ